MSKNINSDSHFCRFSKTVNAYRNASELPLSRRAKAFVGGILRRLSPGLASQVRERPFSGEWGAAGKFIRNAELADAVAAGDHRALQRYHRDFWSSAVAESHFYDRFANRYEDLFLRHHAGIVDRIAEVLGDWGAGARVVEAGAGDGLVLAHLADRLPEIESLHGIDLNADQVEASRKAHSREARLSFHAADALDWLARNPAPKTLLFTNGGVLEYFLRDELLELFRELKASGGPCAVALTESVGLDHRFEVEPESYPYGLECALSHNYPRILEEAGYRVCWTRDRPTEPGEENHPTRWFQAVAEG
jgi:SAM-dependent methyltransferase